jgi:hypothetical protein
MDQYCVLHSTVGVLKYSSLGMPIKRALSFTRNVGPMGRDKRTVRVSLFSENFEAGVCLTDIPHVVHETDRRVRTSETPPKDKSIALVEGMT